MLVKRWFGDILTGLYYFEILLRGKESRKYSFILICITWLISRLIFQCRDFYSTMQFFSFKERKIDLFQELQLAIYCYPMYWLLKIFVYFPLIIKCVKQVFLLYCPWQILPPILTSEI